MAAVAVAVREGE
uniref:Eukaryotic translation initiation factor 2B subunit delta n=2 Tax=Catarrhini TaxID=9526 RepID=F8WEV6_HUMAN